MKTLRLLSLVMTLSFSIAASAAPPLQGLAEIGGKSKSLGAFLLSLRGKVADAEFKEMKILAEDERFRDLPMPKVKAEGIDTLVIEEHGSVFKYKMISHQRGEYSINGKSLDFSDNPGFLERFERIAKALPNRKTSGVWMGVLNPPARAFLPALGAYGMYVFFGGTAALGGAATAYVGNDNKCREIGEALDKCRIQVSEILDYAARKNANFKTTLKKLRDNRKARKADDQEEIDAEDQAWAEAFEHKTGDKCGGNMSSALSTDKETAEVISAGYRLSRQSTANLAFCGNTNTRLQECTRSLGAKAKDMCFTRVNRLLNSLQWETTGGAGDSPQNFVKPAPAPTTGNGAR